MKKFIIGVLLTINICYMGGFAGMLTSKGESRGVAFIGYSKAIDCDYCDPARTIGGSYVLKNGIEFGLGRESDASLSANLFEIGYHLKNEPLNCYLSYGRAKFESDDWDYYNEEPEVNQTSIGISIYTKNAYVNYSSSTLEMELYGYQMEEDFDFLSFGGIMSIGNKAWALYNIPMN